MPSRFEILCRCIECVPDHDYECQHFQRNAESVGWDETFSGEHILPGAYIRYAEVLMVDGRMDVLKGDVTLRR